MMSMHFSLQHFAALPAVVSVWPHPCPPSIDALAGESVVLPHTQYTASMLQWAALQGDIARWTKLEADWDGRDGVALSAGAAESASAFLADARLAGLSLPEAYIAGDGEVGFRWNTDGGFASVSFLADGHIVGFVRSGVAEPFRLDEPASDLVDTDGLIKRISKLS